MAAGGPRFLEGHAKIVVNQSTRQTTLLSIIIAAKETIFLLPFTPRWSEWELGNLDPPLSAIRVWAAAPIKWRTGGGRP